MIEGCIVAKLVFGYLEEEGFSRTCSTFQEECSYFHNGNREIDMKNGLREKWTLNTVTVCFQWKVLLTADLKTILDDYSRSREAGRENTSSSMAVIKSLWKELDVLIGQLKYATIPVAPRSSLSSQSARTRKLNYVSRPWKSTAPTSQTSSPTVVQQQTSSVLHGKNSDKLPLPRLSRGGLSQNQLLHLHQSQVAEPQLLTSTSSVAVSLPIFTQANTAEPVILTEMSRSHRTGQVAGCNLTFSTLPAVRQEDQTLSISKTSILRTENPDSFNSDNQVETSAALECAAKVMDYSSDASNKGGSDIMYGAESAVHSGPERSKITTAICVRELSASSHCNATQDELHLKSPKRKCVQPKKRTVQGDAVLPSVGDSPVKSVTCTSSSATQDVQFLENPSWDMTSPQYFVDKLLNTPLLQEKLAENINKVVGSSRQQPIQEDEEGSSNIMIAHQVTIGNSAIASSESCDADIPVEDIMEQMQADPAFDALFSMFGLDALGDSALSKESPTDAAADGLITSTMPGPMDASNSLSTASNLHSSATSIVTDALLLLAGSPQKPPQPTLCQSGLPSWVPHSENVSTVTSPLQRQSANDTSTDRCPATKPSHSLAEVLMTNLPYVRALDFSVGKDDLSTSDKDRVKIMGRRKGTKNKKSTKQGPLKDNSSKQIQSQHKASASQTHNRVPFGTINVESSDACLSDAKFSGVINQNGRSTGTHSGWTDLYTALTPCARSALRPPTAVPPLSLPSLNPATVGVSSVANISTAPLASPIDFANLDFLARPSIRPTPSPCTVSGPRDFIGNSTSLMPSSVSAASHASCPTASPIDSSMQSKSTAIHLSACPANSPVSLTCQGSFNVNLTSKGTNPNHSPVNLMRQDTSLPYSVVNLTQAHTSATSFTSAAHGHPPTTCPSTVNVNYVGLNPSLLASHSGVTRHGISPGVNLGLAPVVSTSNTSTLSSSSSSMVETRDTGEQWSSEMLSTETLKASNMLHTLAVSHANSQRCSTGDAGGQLIKENVEGLKDGLPFPYPVLLPKYLQWKELCTSRKSSNICKDKSEALIVAPARMDNARKESVVYWNELDSSDYQKWNASKSIIRDHESGVVMDKNSNGFTQTRTAASDVNRVEPSGKRQRSLSSQHKVKKCKGSRIVKKFKSKDDSIHFPKNLNVEEFLSRLCYEEK